VAEVAARHRAHREAAVKRLLVVLAACSGTAKPVEHPPIDTPTGPAPVVEWQKLVGPIKSIAVTSPDATLIAKVKEALAIEIGKPIDRRRLRGELATVLAMKGVADVDAGAKQLDDGVELVITLAPQPSLHALVAREVGGSEIPLPGQLATATNLPVDPAMLDSVTNMLREQYLAKGFTDVTATWTQAEAGKGQSDVAISVVPGKASTITKVEFKGNAHAKQADLEKAIAEDASPGRAFEANHIDRAALVITAYYYDHGYVNVKIDSPRASGEAAPATFTITEGPQFKLGKIEVKGVSADDAKKYRAMVKAKTGDVFSRSVLADAIQKIQEAAKAVVTPLTDVKVDKKIIDLTIDISKS
jgi:outer membrane protein insertion porin family